MNWLRQIFFRRRMTRELSEEMQQHLDERIEALIADGMPRAEAVHTGRRAFGNATLVEQRSREVWNQPVRSDRLRLNDRLFAAHRSRGLHRAS
jgi:uncharacterized protein YoaH (UPF0181 family)